MLLEDVKLITFDYICSYCGQWVASPALGSAGPTLKIIAYAIAIPGLIAGGKSTCI
jgi:hypothetical protein